MINNSLKTTDWDVVFKTELIIISDKVRAFIQSYKTKKNYLKNLEIIAEDFFNKFENSPIPVRAFDHKQSYSPDMVSTTIVLPYGCMMIPYFFVEVYTEDIDISFDEEFSQQVTWSELVGILFQKWYDRRKKLTKTMVLICKTLSRYGVQGQLYRFPLTFETIKNRVRQSFSSVKTSVPLLYTELIVRDIFLINPWKLGWELYLVTYPLLERDSFSNLDNLTIAIEICAGNILFRVIQQPILDSGKNLIDIREKLNQIHGKIYLINSTDFHWDLTQLDSREEKSFQEIPNFLGRTTNKILPNVHFQYESSTVDWLINQPITHEYLEGEEHFKKSNAEIFTDLKKERIMRVLNYLIDFGAPLINYENTAEKIGLPVNELSGILHFLIENRIIALAQRFKTIGAGKEYSFLIENTNSELNELIKQSLLQCVFSYIYESKNMIAGRLQVPDKWVAKLIEFFTRLQFRNLELKITFGQRLLGFSLFIPNIKLPQNFILNEFGMKNMPQ